ncbi:MAG: FAD-binding oxidoreductase [Alphaproteobacteria bacterium]|nr:FAD-binding oxidoreductase [Alphaproteobacteria bacterium]
MPVTPELLERIARAVGPLGVIGDPEGMAPYLREERGLYRGASPLVVRPSTTAEVAEVVRLCAEVRATIVPQGGNTGLVGGGVPFGDILLSTRRLNRIRSIDPVDYTATVEAGCILSDIQDAADRVDRLFPLSLAAEGSCHIGGNISTNAGGLAVLRYGNTRDLVLGLEVVLPDGRVWNGLRALAKDNTGYALKHLFIGAEGTLGIVTAAVMKLFPKSRSVETALCAVDRLDDVLKLLSHARAATGDRVSAFELLPRFGLELVLRHLPSVSDPLSRVHPWYVLIEVSSPASGGEWRAGFVSLLSEALENGVIADAVIAESLEQANALWRLREGIPEAQKREGGSIKHDVSVPVSRVPAFLKAATGAVTAALPGVRPCPFGHVGDGNIHFNLTQPEGAGKEAFLAQWERLNRIVHDIVADMGGSVSAEHGVGLLKKEEIRRYKTEVELDLMRRIKIALDPDGIMNPGKLA